MCVCVCCRKFFVALRYPPHHSNRHRSLLPYLHLRRLSHQGQVTRSPVSDWIRARLPAGSASVLRRADKSQTSLQPTISPLPLFPHTLTHTHTCLLPSGRLLARQRSESPLGNSGISFRLSEPRRTRRSAHVPVASDGSSKGFAAFPPSGRSSPFHLATFAQISRLSVL